MILGFLSMVAANAAIFLGARLLLVRVGTGVLHLDLGLFLILRLALISTVVLIAGVTRTLSALPLGIAGAVALAVMLALGAKKQLRPATRPDWSNLLAWMLGLAVLRLLLQVWFFAPYNYDAVSYHLTKIPEWIRAGGFTREMGVDTHATFPAGFELVETWWAVFLHHDVLIEMAGVEFLALAFLGCYALARELGMAERPASWAAFVFAMTPGLQLSATSCLNDVPVAGLILWTMVLILARAPWPWLVLVAGLGIGIKPTYGYALPGFVLLALLGRRETDVTTPLPRLGGTRFALAGLGALTGIFWYARNALWFGNPVHPVGARGLVGGTGDLKIQVGPSFISGWKNLFALVNHRVYDDHVAYGALLNHLSGWGAIGFACGAVALWPWIREVKRAGRVVLAFLASMVSILFLVNHDDWCLRFVLFFPALLAIAGVWLAERSKPVAILIGVALGFQFLATLVPVDLRLEQVRKLAKMNWRERTTGALWGSMPTSGEPVVYRVIEPVHDRGESYLLYGPGYERRVIYFRGVSIDDLERLLKESSAGWFYAARINPKVDPLLVELEKRGVLKRAGGRLYQRL